MTRLNTYTTVPAIWTKEQELQARSVDIVTFASPSTVKSWSEKVGTDYTAVAIGPTSHSAAVNSGFNKVLSPNGSKGVEAWADEVNKAVKEVAVRKRGWSPSWIVRSSKD